MLAYNKTWLNNLIIEQDTEDAKDNGFITPEEFKAVKDKYPVGFYTPNTFIRVGLFILTVIIASLGMGLLALMLLSGSGEDVFSGLLIFFAILCYIMLEVMVQSKFHYRSGVDDALMLMAGIFLVSGINIASNISFAANAFIIFLLAGWFTLRFADMLMGAVTFLALLASAFYLYQRITPHANATMPFMIIILSVAIYFLTRVLSLKTAARNYRNVITMVEFLSLLSLYAAGNYFVVRESIGLLHDVDLPEGTSIPFGWFFWMLTLLIPVIYIIAGIHKRNTVLLRAGLLLVAFMVFTVHNYYSVFPMEVPMTIGGAIMIVVAGLLIRYLKVPKFGFTYKEATRKHALDKLNVEALIITETMGTAPAPGSSTQFGGGSGGGAGATGGYE